jgi:isopenicillin-N epimerase
LERQPVEFLGRRFTELMREARTRLAEYVHTAPDNLVYMPNATTALNIVARAVGAFYQTPLHPPLRTPLHPGDEILTTDHEYGAMDRMWRFLCRKTGAVYKQQPIPVPVTTHADFVETLWAGITPRTRVLFLSHITSPTALIFPLAELCRRARAAGILSIVDGAHALGQISLNLDALGADFYTSNAHKWLCSPKGSAFLYARPEVLPLIEPLVVSWGYEAEEPGPSRFIDEQEWTGTRDIAAYLTVPDAIKFYEEHHWDAVREHCHALAQQARVRLTAITGLPPLSPDSTDWYAQMVTMPLPPCDAKHPQIKWIGGCKQLKARLYDEFKIEVPIVVWRDQPYIRVSIQAYNTPEDVDRLVEALGKLLD